MSISSATRKAGPYSGNGVTVDFPFSFKVFAAADVLVVFTDLTGVETVLVLGAEYTVAISSNQDSNPGGTVTLPAALDTGAKLTLASAVANLQPVTLTNQGGFYPKVINDALDRATIQIQQLAEEVGRAVKVGISSEYSPDDLIDQLVVDPAAAIQAAANAAASVESANNSATSAAGSANGAANAAVSAANSAAIAADPVANVVAAYLDMFVPTGELLTFTAMYQIGGWDFGNLVAPAPFQNEAAGMRRASLSAGSGTFNFGSLS